MWVRGAAIVVYTGRDGSLDVTRTPRRRMSRLLGRSVFGAAIALVGLGWLSPALPRVHAQSRDEVVSDPELGSRSRRHRRSRRSRGQGNASDEVVAAPELSADASADNRPEAGGWDDVEEAGSSGSPSTASTSNAPSADEVSSSADDTSGADEVMTYDDESPASTSSSDYDPQANTGIARLEAIGQFGADIRHEGDLEDAYETRLRFDAEIEFRRSRKVRLSVGLRTDLLWALPAGGDALLTVDADEREKRSPPAHYSPVRSGPLRARHIAAVRLRRRDARQRLPPAPGHPAGVDGAHGLLLADRHPGRRRPPWTGQGHALRRQARRSRPSASTGTSGAGPRCRSSICRGSRPICRGPIAIATSRACSERAAPTSRSRTTS